jgi:hypothetical protein
MEFLEAALFFGCSETAYIKRTKAQSIELQRTNQKE